MNRGPFLHGGRTTRRLMVQVLLALAPAAAAALWRHGEAAASLIGGSLAAAWLAQAAFARRAALHESALVTGAVLALMLPASAPWWLGAVGGAAAVAFGKRLGGGPGNAIFNPAALARAVLMGLAPALLFAPSWPADGVTAASPLSKEIDSVAPRLADLLLGAHPGSLAEASPLAVLAGGLLLVAFRTVDGRVPLVYLAGVSFLALVLPAGERAAGHAPWLEGDALVHILGGGTLLAAFFLLTDPVTSPFTARGRIAFAAIAAAATMLPRLYTPYPDAAALAVLVANAAAPWIDRRTLPRPHRLAAAGS
ncbi:MAG: RnfABCDGE type electron transport complex subunit D [Planctomycetes bacterium]|nr:RnfABCDGE type electron transport complex subunit D [Planctomycetota bacterium]